MPSIFSKQCNRDVLFPLKIIQFTVGECSKAGFHLCQDLTVSSLILDEIRPTYSFGESSHSFHQLEDNPRPCSVLCQGQSYKCDGTGLGHLQMFSPSVSSSPSPHLHPIKKTVISPRYSLQREFSFLCEAKLKSGENRETTKRQSELSLQNKRLLVGYRKITGMGVEGSWLWEKILNNCGEGGTEKGKKGTSSEYRIRSPVVFFLRCCQDWNYSSSFCLLDSASLKQLQYALGPMRTLPCIWVRPRVGEEALQVPE